MINDRTKHGFQIIASSISCFSWDGMPSTAQKQGGFLPESA